MYYHNYPRYVSVGERRGKAQKKLKQLRKQDPSIKPVIINGRTLASTWWGKSWNSNLERYADYRNRIGRGRSYVRHGSVLDLQIVPEKITALVQGSRSTPYHVDITVQKLSARNWSVIRKACEGCFDSLGELLGGRFPESLKNLFFEKGAGLFPSPREIEFDCSCPDWASMCKHVAAVLYGVGARLDDDPSLFFSLRGITIDDLITQTVAKTTGDLLRRAESRSGNILQDVDLGDVFGIQIDDMDTPSTSLPPVQLSDTKTATNTADSRKTASKDKGAQSGKKVKSQRNAQRSRSYPASRKTSDSGAAAGVAQVKNVGIDPSKKQRGNMLTALIKALGKSRKGKSVRELEEKLGWTTTQVRNALGRATAKGLVEFVNAGVYRQKR